MNNLRTRAGLAIAALTIAACSNASDPPAHQDPPGCDLAGVAEADCARAHALALSDALPPGVGNKYADDEAAATFGFHLFFDAEIGHGVGCFTCHAPELAFTDRKSVSQGKGVGTRNAPTAFNAARLTVIFWDGRADSLWSQPLFAIENPLEMGSSRLELAHTVAASALLSDGYRKTFGSVPDVSAWPASGKPGDPAWDELPSDQQDQVNRVAANVGKALQAYMRKNTTSKSALDRYLGGDDSQMNEVAQRGLVAFLENRCDRCHAGPLLTDEGFHDVGFPSLPGAAPDPGRADALAVLENNVFNLEGPYADPGPGVPGKVARGPAAKGAFRTPSLRNVTRTAPYGHDGAFATLDELLVLHAADASADNRAAIVAFLGELNGDYPYPPWNNWPSAQ